MDAGGQKFFPNLKISIDKTKSSSEEDETSDLDSKYDIDKVSMKLDCPSDGEMRDDKNEDDVRYNVRIGKFTESFPGHNYDGNRGKRVYENKMGDFITGIDILSEESQLKKKKRASRFRLQEEDTQQAAMDVHSVYNSLGVVERDLHNDEKELRGDTLHLRGTDNMTTEDVFEYFSEFPAHFLEWIDDTSCNVVWDDRMTPVRALWKLSRSYTDVMGNKASIIGAKKLECEGGGGEKDGCVVGDLELSCSQPNDDVTSDVNRAGVVLRDDSMDTDDDHLNLMSEEEDVLPVENTRLCPGQSDLAVDDGGEKRCSTCNEDKGKEVPVGDSGDDEGLSHDLTKSGVPHQIVGKSTSGGANSGSRSSFDSSLSLSGFRADFTPDSFPANSDHTAKMSSIENKKETSMQYGQDNGDRGKHLSDIPWPPGKWRLGVSCCMAEYVFLRFALKSDKKELGSERKSLFYLKHGNPNYGGVMGLLSSSRKRRLRSEMEERGGKVSQLDARLLINGKKALKGVGHLSRGLQNIDPSNLMSDDDWSDGSSMGNRSSSDHVTCMARPTDLRQLLSRQNMCRDSSVCDTVPSSYTSTTHELASQEKPTGRPFDEDRLDLDAELKHLMPSANSKTVRPRMKMYADEEEMKLQRRSSMLDKLPVTEANRDSSRRYSPTSRLGLRLFSKGSGSRHHYCGRLTGNSLEHNKCSQLCSEDEECDDEESDEDDVSASFDYSRELKSYQSMRKLAAGTSESQQLSSSARIEQVSGTFPSMFVHPKAEKDIDVN